MSILTDKIFLMYLIGELSDRHLSLKEIIFDEDFIDMDITVSIPLSVSTYSFFHIIYIKINNERMYSSEAINLSKYGNLSESYLNTLICKTKRQYKIKKLLDI